MLEGYQERRRESWLQVVWAVVMICNSTGRLTSPLRVDRLMRRLGFLPEKPSVVDPDVKRSPNERLRNLEQDIDAGHWTEREEGELINER